MKIDHISFSREQCFKECHAKYRFQYHLQVATDQPTPFYFTFGKAVHRCIEEHEKSRGKKTIARAKSEVFNGEFGDQFPKFDNKSHVRLNSHLANYMRLAEKIGYDGEIEWSFLVDIDPPHNRCLKGLLDRLIIKNNNAFIIDWKTTKPSKWRKDSSNITKDLQLACYCWVVHNKFGIPAKNIKAALYYLSDAKLVPVVFSQKTLNSVQKRMTQVFKEIEQYDPDKVFGNVGPHCRDCPFRPQCPFYSLVET